jgi:hypothetical protein
MIQILSRCASVEGMKRYTGSNYVLSNWGMASIRLYTLTVVFVLVEWNNAAVGTPWCKESDKVNYDPDSKQVCIGGRNEADRGRLH